MFRRALTDGRTRLVVLLFVAVTLAMSGLGQAQILEAYSAAGPHTSLPTIILHNADGDQGGG